MVGVTIAWQLNIMRLHNSWLCAMATQIVLSFSPVLVSVIVEH